jgi:hypothetical protein
LVDEAGTGICPVPGFAGAGDGDNPPPPDEPAPPEPAALPEPAAPAPGGLAPLEATPRGVDPLELLKTAIRSTSSASAENTSTARR